MVGKPGGGPAAKVIRFDEPNGEQRLKIRGKNVAGNPVLLRARATRSAQGAVASAGSITDFNVSGECSGVKRIRAGVATRPMRRKRVGIGVHPYNVAIQMFAEGFGIE